MWRVGRPATYQQLAEVDLAEQLRLLEQDPEHVHLRRLALLREWGLSFGPVRVVPTHLLPHRVWRPHLAIILQRLEQGLRGRRPRVG